MLPLEKGFSPNQFGCRDVLTRDVSATAALVAASGLVFTPFEETNPLFDDDGEILDFDAVDALVTSKVPDLDRDNLHRLYGLVTAAAGDEFFNDPDHFERMVGAIVYGDPYRFEEDMEAPSLVEMTWAIFQVDLMVEEDADSLLSDAVADRLAEIAAENPADAETLAEIDPDFSGSVEDFYLQLLGFRKIALEKDLRKCGAGSEFIAELGLHDHSQS